MGLLSGIGIGTFVLVWFDTSGFRAAFYQGTQGNIALFLIGAFLVRVPIWQIQAVAT